MDHKRIRLTTIEQDKNGGTIGYIEISVVSRASPTQYEQRYVWSGHAPVFIDGIFVRRLVVDKACRGKGHGKTLFRRALNRASEMGKHLYCDTKSDNAAMRELARSLGGKENMFWHTPSGTLMVRYIWQ